MANIIRREPEDEAMPLRAHFEPLHFLRGLLPWDPFRGLQRLGARPGWLEFWPDVEVKETADAYVVKADVPGVKDEDIDISVSGNQLTISGKREAEKEEKGDTFYTYERSYGTPRRWPPSQRCTHRTCTTRLCAMRTLPSSASCARRLSPFATR